jgi:hypothetical protein
MKTITIVGGGSAGWMVAAYFASTKKYKVILIESPNIPIVGVGESTIPSIVDFMEKIGITENDLFQYCSAIRKYTIEHNNWNGKNESWYHHFCFSENEHDEQIDWMNKYIIPQKKWRWSYHLDATKLGHLIKDKSAIPNGVIHILDDIIDVKTDELKILYITGKNNNYYSDLFVDCTGFKSLLRSKFPSSYGKNSSLINNMAICGPGEYTDHEKPLPYTQTFSMDYGWRWRVSIQHRTGNGYAFNSNYIDLDSAKSEFIEKTPGIIKDQIFVVPIKNGYNKTPWYSNVVSMGLSCGFLEPLEATGLFLVHGPVMLLEKLLDDKNGSIKFNKIWTRLYEHIADFLSMHYRSSSLNHTDYWNSFNKIQHIKTPETKQFIFDQYSYRNLSIARGLPYT